MYNLNKNIIYTVKYLIITNIKHLKMINKLLCKLKLGKKPETMCILDSLKYNQILKDCKWE